jgi:hypothetical protein
MTEPIKAFIVMAWYVNSNGVPQESFFDAYTSFELATAKVEQYCRKNSLDRFKWSFMDQSIGVATTPLFKFKANKQLISFNIAPFTIHNELT